MLRARRLENECVAEAALSVAGWPSPELFSTAASVALASFDGDNGRRQRLDGIEAGRRGNSAGQRGQQVFQTRIARIVLVLQDFVAGQEVFHDLEAERAIALELGLAEPLVTRALMREIGVSHGIAS